MSQPSRALIVGASRGLGLAIAEQYLKRGLHVTATARSSGGELERLAAQWPGKLAIELADINLPEQVAALRARLAGNAFDLLFVNAGVKNDDRQTIADVPTDEFVRVMVTNALSPLRLVETLGDLVSAGGTIGFMSSGQGSVANNEKGGYEVYRASKAALNTLVRSYGARHAADGHTLLLMAPGWIKTDMGGDGAPFTIDQAIPVLVDTIEKQRGKGGVHYIDRFGAPVPW